MYACIHIPEFALQSVLRHEPELVRCPVGLLEDAGYQEHARDRGRWKILQLNAAARRLGVEKGMTGTQGQGRCRDLVLRVRSVGNEMSAQEAVMQWASDITPRIESTAGGVALLHLKGSRYARGQHEELGQKCVEALGLLHLYPQVGIASNPSLALLAARHASPLKVVPDTEKGQREFLDPLPVESLGLDAEMKSVFQGWGIRTLGQLKKLPKNDVVERLGAAVLPLWEMACGGRDRPLKIHVPNENLMEATDFENGIERLEALIFAINRFLNQMLVRLEMNYLAVAEVRMRLNMEDGTHHEHLFRLPEPTRKGEQVIRVIHTYLENFRSEAPVTGLTLEARPARPVQQQLSLFESTLRDPNRFAETVARLEALIGQGRVGNPEVPDSNRPDEVTMGLFAPGMGKVKKPDVARRRLGLPLRRFRPPCPVRVQLQQVEGKSVVIRITSAKASGSVRLSSGPWQQSGDWWNEDQWEREEWDLELDQGGLFRLVREKGEWTLEGMYD